MARGLLPPKLPSPLSFNSKGGTAISPSALVKSRAVAPSTSPAKRKVR
jgi:hypothetical protein